MVNVLVSGVLGRMGQKVVEATLKNENVKVVCGVDILEKELSFPVYTSFDQVKEKVDVVIDFSNKANLDNVLTFLGKTGASAVLCTTGFDACDLEKIDKISQTNAIFRSANMSLGVNILIELVKKASLSLKGFDIEIIEKHHNQKVDAPSGTALMLADAVKDVLPEKFYTYGREGMCGKRNPDEIGIHAIRGGNIVGEHDVIFAGANETVTLSHQASDRSVFAEGAVLAAEYISTKKSGMYNMSDLINKR
jgi:4-hydroxy-tetrahydrodipicolinate reductase